MNIKSVVVAFEHLHPIIMKDKMLGSSGYPTYFDLPTNELFTSFYKGLLFGLQCSEEENV